MPDPYALLGVTPEVSVAELKAAYHRQLRQFPAHSHPQEFQRIRAAYDTLRAVGEHQGDPLQPGPMLTQLDAEALAAFDRRVRNACQVDLATLLRLTL
ncbi:MAG: molecular chaperone DnaJ [Cyanobacteriota bacterium]|jgi:hypothetical protein|nr:molecular chaperone DnaJ [Cyanobacteriota bacterium]